MTFGSLFAGIGGMDLGLERSGMECSWQVEIDDYATRVLERHWPDVPKWRDIRTFPPDAVRTEFESGTGRRRIWEGDTELTVDLICGGFPCQDISYAGRGAGLDGQRSGLFFEAIRVVRQLRPRYVLLENVAALLTRGLDRVHGELATIGFDSESHCIPAAAVGAPHIRDRVFVIAVNSHTEFDSCLEIGPEASRGIKENWEAGKEGRRRRVSTETRRIRNGMADTERERLEGAEQQRQRIMQQHRPSNAGWWSTEPDVGRVANGISSRMDRLRGLGNAVVPQVAEYIGRMIVQNEGRTCVTRHDPKG